MTFMGVAFAALGQKGTFIALDNRGSLYSLDINGCTKTQLTLTGSFAGNLLSIGLNGNTLYLTDNKGTLYSSTVNSNGTISNTTPLGTFKNAAIYGLTVGPDGTVYAASSNIIETYTPATNSFGLLGSLPSNYTIGGDLLFYQGVLYEVCANGDLVAVNMKNPSLSTTYMTFTTGSIFGLASVTAPCSNNLLYAVDRTGSIYLVDMAKRTQSSTTTCTFGMNIYDAASIAETESTPPPTPPLAISPIVYCVNTTSTQLKATVSGMNDTLKWYSQSTGDNTILPPTPFVGSTSTSDTFYVSQIDTTTKCESLRTPIIVNVDTFSNPSLKIVAKSTIICSGGEAIITAIPFNGGIKPHYQWQVNGTNIGIDTSVFISNTLNDKDKVSCLLTSNALCKLSQNAVSNIVEIDTLSKIIPSISISSSSISFCPGTSVTFTSNPINGGTLPILIWEINGIDVGKRDTSFTTSTLNNGDAVSCVLVSNVVTCILNDTATSNKIKLSVTAKNLPTITISTDNTNICSGTALTFTSTETHGGNAPTYQWKINGMNVPKATASSFTTTTLKDMDVVTCNMISNESCLISNLVSSNSIPISVVGNPVPKIMITTKDTSICPNTTVTFSASISNYNQTGISDWIINGTVVGSNTNDSLIKSNINNGDVVNCRLIVNTGCILDTVFSNSLNMRVITSLSPSVSISTDTITVCSGKATTFMAVAIDGGSSPYYQWKLNSVNVGSDSLRFITNTLNDGDVVSCTITSDIPCLINKSATSQPIKMGVINPPYVSEISGTNIICQGKSLSLTNATTGGIWKSNVQEIATIDSLKGSVTGINAGSVAVYYSKSNTCGITTKSFIINVTDSPKVYPFVGQNFVCTNESTQLTDIVSGGTWISLNPSIVSIDALNGEVTGLSNGNAMIRYAVSNTCGTVSVTQPIYVAGAKVDIHPSILKYPTCILPFSGVMMISLNGKESPYKYFLNGQMYQNGQEVSNLSAGTCTAYIYNSYGCLVDSLPNIELKLMVDASCDTFYVPTGFIPESKYEVNRILKPFGGTSAIDNLTFKVYNRFGDLVFETHDSNIGWDGTIYGNKAATGTYVWYLEYKYINKTTRKIKGTTVLIR